MSDLKVDGIIASTGTNTALTLQGKGSGKVDIGDGALSFPDADGSANQVISTTGGGVLQFATISTGFTQGTPVATTSGTAVTFGSIPAGVDMIVINFQAVGWATKDFMEVEIGDAGGIETSGYVGENLGVPGHVATQATDCFRLSNDLNAAQAFNGQATLTLQNASTFYWVCTAMLADTVHSTAVVEIYGGAKALSAELTQLTIAGSGGQTFDTGAVNIMYQ